MRTPRALPAVKAAPRAVDPRLRRALRELLEGRHRGIARAATWETLLAEVRAEGVDVGCTRRLQECASILRRADKVAVCGTSQSGIYVALDERDRRLAAGERVKRIRAEVEELAAFDVALYQRIAGALAMVTPANDEGMPQGTPSPGERVAGEDGSNTEQHGAGRPASGSKRASQHTETLQRRGSGEGEPPASPAAANTPVFPQAQLGLAGGSW